MKRVKIKVEIYSTELTVLVGNSDEFLQFAEGLKSENFKEKFKANFIKVKPRGFLTKEKTYIVGVVLDRLEGHEVEAVLAHELFHACEKILVTRGIKLEGEQTAYLLGYLMNKALKGIRKKEKK